MKTKRSNKDSLIIKLIDGDRHKHSVALVTDEGEWNQHEPNTGMARMFVVMLLIHVVLIGGIIVYDFMGDEEAPAQSVTQAARATSASSGLPQASEAVLNAQANAVAQGKVGEDFEVYEMRSGDSLPSIAQKFNTTEKTLTELNLLDKGITIGPGTRLRVPRQPAVAAVPVDPQTLKPKTESAPAPATEDVPRAIPFTLSGPPATQGEPVKPEDAPASIAAASSPMALTAPGELPPSTGNSLLAAAEAPATTPAPAENVEVIGGARNPAVVNVLAQAQEENEKALAAAAEAERQRAEAPAAPKEEPPAPAPKAEEPKKVVKQEAKPEPKPLAKPNPVPTPTQMTRRLADTPPAPKSSSKKSATTTKESPPKSQTATKPAAASRSHTLASGETLYRLSTKYGVSVAAIQKANNIKNPNAMREGMKLVIPAK